MVGGDLNCSLVFIVFGSISMLSGKFPNLGLTGSTYFISLAKQKVHCALTRLLFSSFHAEKVMHSTICPYTSSYAHRKLKKLLKYWQCGGRKNVHALPNNLHCGFQNAASCHMPDIICSFLYYQSEKHGTVCEDGSYVIWAWQLDQSQIFLHHAIYE